MYEPQEEPEARVEIAEPKLPRVRRPRVKAERAPAATEPSAHATSAESPAAAPPAAGGAASATRDVPAPRAALRPAHPPRTQRQDAGLRPGERWKRRLPRILR